MTEHSEYSVRFGAEGHLVATFTEPVPASHGRPDPPRVMVLLTNAGVISRVGPHRINVALARHLAALGLPAMRWDLSGLGDSGRPARPLPVREQFVADTRAAMDEAQRRFGVDRFVMIGFCSGAEVAYHAAQEDARLAALVLFDLFVYPTLKTQALRVLRRLRKHGLAGALARVPPALQRLARQRAGGAEESLSLASGRPPAAEFARVLRALHARGARLLVVYAGELDAYNYQAQFADRFRSHGLAGKVDCVYLPQADHVFTTARAQRQLVDTVQHWIGAWLGLAPASQSGGEATR